MVRRKINPAREFPYNENRLFDRRRLFLRHRPDRPAAFLSQLKARIFAHPSFIDFHDLNRQVTRLMLRNTRWAAKPMRCTRSVIQA